MQAKIDPPLESIWVYAALTVRSGNFTNDDPLNRLSVTNDLFQLISACSSSCSSSKSIALLAPVVLEVYKVAVELKARDLSSKREKTVNRELKSLIDTILGFVSVCCCNNFNGERDVVDDSDLHLIVPVKDLIGLWMNRNASLESFLPLVNVDSGKNFGEEVCDVNYFAGLVIVEVFMLKLWLSFRVGATGEELEKELMSWVISSITKFQNIYFFESLMKMLLEPTLPLTHLLSSQDEELLKKVLYDALILVEYSFLNPERVVHLPVEYMKGLAMTRLIVTHEAIERLREIGDHKRAISYASAFSSSKLSSQIIKWSAGQIGMDEKTSGSFGSSPKALLKWLLRLENQGIRVFDDKILKSRATLAVHNSKADYEQLSSIAEGKEANDGIVFYVDNQGEDEDSEHKNESMNAAFLAAAHLIKVTEHGERKRKERGSTGKKKKIKYEKVDLSDNYGSNKGRVSSVIDEGSGSESENEEPVSDEDVETKGQ